MSNFTSTHIRRRTYEVPKRENIKVQYPDCASIDYVSQTWLSQYFYDLPTGTIIHKPNGQVIIVT